MSSRTPPRLLALLAALLCFHSAPAQELRKPELLVFAAASLTQVLEELSAAWQQVSGQRVRLSFAASSLLARQIEAGGNADVFVSADQQWMDYLAERNLIDTRSRQDLAANGLVLIAPADSAVALRITRGFGLAAALGNGRLAIADPDNVPAGRYARSALRHLGAWDSVAGRLAMADNVRAALTYVSRGEAPLGIVYSTDARGDPKVRVVAAFPDDTHPPITYPAAATAQAGPGAEAYLRFLNSERARLVWKKFGFRELKP
jgi:molybdate transport system substrate-binding protein